MWGESEQGSGRSFRRQAETESSGLCDDEAEGRLCRPEHFNPEWDPGGPWPAGVGRQGPLRASDSSGGAVQVIRTHKGPGHLPGARSIVRPLRGPTAGGTALCAVQAFSPGSPHEPSGAGRVGRVGTRERTQFSPSGGNGVKRTLRRRGGGAALPPRAFQSRMGPRRALARWGTAAKARYEHHPAGPHPQSSEAAGDGRGGAAEGVSFRADAEANDPQLVPTRWSCTSN